MSRWRDRLVVALATVILGTTLVSAQPFSRPGGPGLTVVSGGGGGVTGLTSNGCATVNAVLKMHASTANTAACSSIVDDGTNVNPDANDGAALGAPGTAWSDLFLASGGVINLAGDITLTHSTDTLTLAGGVLALPAGTAAAPSLAVRNANAGLFSTVDGWVMISTAGVARWIISSGEVRMESSALLGWSSGDPTAANADVITARAAAGVWHVYGSSTAVAATLRTGSANAGYTDNAPITEAHTLAAAGTSTTATAVFPASSASISAAFRITTEITGCTSVQVGVSGDVTRFGTFSTLTAGQTIGIGRVDNYSAQTGVLFTCVGGGASFTAGVIRVNLRYNTATAPTS